MKVLSIPIKHVGGDQGRQLYKDVIIDDSTRWQQQHWKTLTTAYRSSPFFEYYEDDLKPLFTEPIELLYDFNINTIEFITEQLGLSVSSQPSTSYEKSPDDINDKRSLVISKGSLIKPLNTTKYLETDTAFKAIAVLWTFYSI